MRSALFALLSLSVFACCPSRSTAPPEVAERVVDVDGPVQCGADRFKSKEHCFDHAKEACDWLACAHGCDIVTATSSRMVVCSANEASSSHLTKCGGFANWQCPDETTCVYTPEAAQADDATGTCIAVTADAGAPRCGGFANVKCPTGMRCELPQTRCRDCAGVCVTN